MSEVDLVLYFVLILHSIFRIIDNVFVHFCQKNLWKQQQMNVIFLSAKQKHCHTYLMFF